MWWIWSIMFLKFFFYFATWEWNFYKLVNFFHSAKSNKKFHITLTCVFMISQITNNMLHRIHHRFWNLWHEWNVWVALAQKLRLVMETDRTTRNIWLGAPFLSPPNFTQLIKLQFHTITIFLQQKQVRFFLDDIL